MYRVHQTLISILSEWRGKRVFFHPGWGNHGDFLIRLGSEKLLAESEVELTANPDQADVMILNGSGGLTDGYSGAYGVLQDLYKLNPNVPLIVFPSCIQAADKCQLARSIGVRHGTCHVFARDEYSLARLKEMDLPANVERQIDHDMAFALLDSTLVASLRRMKKRDYCLLLERGDRERATDIQSNRRIRLPLKNHIPSNLRRVMKRTMHKRIASKSPLAFAARLFLDSIQDRHPMPIQAIDASRTDLITFDGFCRLFGEAQSIISTRLHGCILGAMLETPTYCLPSQGELKKLQGVYEYSLRHFAGTHLVKFEQGELTLVDAGEARS